MIKCGDRDTQKSTNCVGNVNRGGRKMGESSFFFFDAHNQGEIDDGMILLETVSIWEKMYKNRVPMPILFYSSF